MLRNVLVQCCIQTQTQRVDILWSLSEPLFAAQTASIE